MQTAYPNHIVPDAYHLHLFVQTIKGFGDILARAVINARQGTDQDRDKGREVLEYWTGAYPRTTPVTASGIITNFLAMGDILTGRGLYEMSGMETNFTPEMVLSGKVVILDIALKGGNQQGGLMIQSAWKLLFQQAIERRADKGQPYARPVFLWEDEAHLFFNHHDVNFQPTARDCRAAHVMISQNLHNFLHLGHNEHAVFAVFGAMNTFIFHTNGDMHINRWASDKIGDVRRMKFTSSGLFKAVPMEETNPFRSNDPDTLKSIGSMSLNEEIKPGLPPEDFAKLVRGGEGYCEAVILRLSHQFASNHGRNFCVLTFEQEARL